MFNLDIDNQCSNLTEECRRQLCISLNSISDRTDPPKRALILSGGVNTCAILDAASSLHMAFAVAITVVVGDNAPDEEFATYASIQYGLNSPAWNRHRIIRISPEDLIRNHLPRTVKLLETWDCIVLRNSLVISVAFEEAKRLGMDDVIVGDGADELFGGYPFMWGSEDNAELWKKKRDEMCQKWTFATTDLAQSYGMKSHGPFLSQSFVSWALANTTKGDCIGERPIKSVLQGESIMHKVGKIILREAFNTCASWRRKDTIEIGSGVTIISKDEYWDEKISDEEYQSEQIKWKRKGEVIKTKESLIYLRTYIQVFGGNVHPDEKHVDIGDATF